MPEPIHSDAVTLPDGRKVRVLAYGDGSVRFRVDGGPYVLDEAFLGGRDGMAVLRLAQRVRVEERSDGGGATPLEVIPFDDEFPSVADVEGIASGFTGDMTTEQFMRWARTG